MLERGVVGHRGVSPLFLMKLVKPLRIPYEELLRAAGYSIEPPLEQDTKEDLIASLCEALGWTVESFAERLGFCMEDISYIESEGATTDTFLMILAPMLQTYQTLTPSRTKLLREAEYVLRTDSQEAGKLESFLEIFLR